MAQEVKRVAVKVDLPKDLDRRLEKEAVRRDVPKRQLVDEAVRRFLSLEVR